MDIDIYILNLPRDTHRLTLCHKELCARGIPAEKIHTWVANDDRDYEKTRQVCEAAIADGFPKYQSFLDRGEHNKRNIAIFTQSWNYCRFFRHLIEIQKDAVLIHDDMKFSPRMTYASLNEVIDFLHNRDEPFYFLTLRVFNTDSERIEVPENPDITYGIYNSSSDTAQVITLEGAEFLLSEFEGYSPPRLEHYLGETFCHKHLSQNAGIYSVRYRSPINCQKFIDGSNIIGPNGYFRAISTTSDNDD